MDRVLRTSVFLAFALFLTACVQYTLIPANQTVSYKSINITPSGNWNKSPAKPGTNVEVWTRDGEAINQLMLIGDISVGQALFKQPSKGTPMPVFKSDMLPDDIQTLVKTSIQNLSAGQLTITTRNLRPVSVGEDFGFRFDFDFYTSSGLHKKGDVLAAIKNNQLYVIIYSASSTHYYDAYQSDIEAMFSGVQI